MVEFQVEFLRTLEDGIKLVPDLDRLERVEQFKVSAPIFWFTELVIKRSYFFLTTKACDDFASHRKCCFPWEARSFITPIASRSTAPSVPATRKSQRSWRKVKLGRACC